MIKKFINVIKQLVFKQDIEFKAKLWKTDRCFKCDGEYDKNSFWAEITEINGAVYQVPVCNKCSGDSEYKAPSN